ARRSGFLRARIDGRVTELEEGMRLDKQKRHTIEILIDRFTVSADSARRLADSLETALRLTAGTASAVRDSKLEAVAETGRKKAMQAEPAVDWFFSEGAACPDCGISVGEMAPRLFSFNSPFGACPSCSGLGTRLEVDPDLVVPDPSKTLNEGALDPWKKIMPSWYEGQVRAAAQHLKVSMDVPWKKLPAKAREALLYGIGGKEISFRYRSKKGKYDYEGKFEGVIPNLERRFKSTASDGAREKLSAYLREGPCRACGGTRLRPEARAVKIQGRNIADWSALDVTAARVEAAGLEFPGTRERIAEPILKEL